MHAFIAGTASPRRHRILTQLGVDFTIFLPDCAEIHDVQNPVKTVTANALAKHSVCARNDAEAWILTADTVVEFEGRCLGKPTDPDDARRMLLSYSGKPQTVFTAVALSAPQQAPDLRIVASAVQFKPYGAEVVEAYLTRAHPYDRAGAYDIDASGDMLIAAYTGSLTNIMGLPAESVSDWLRANAYPFPTQYNHAKFH